MRILAIGDPHGEFDFSKIKNEKFDLILVTGDLGKSDLLRRTAFKNIKRKQKGLEEVYDIRIEKKAVLESINTSIDLVRRFSKIAPVYTIFGNLEESDEEIKKRAKNLKCKLPHMSKEFKKIGVKIINNKLLKINDLKIGGLRFFWDVKWTKNVSENKKWIKLSVKETKTAKLTLRKFKKLDILLCHQPPFGILDKINYPSSPHNGLRAGSKLILQYVNKYQPKYVFCGHIHEAEGMKKVGKTVVYNLGKGGFKIFEI